MGHVVGERSKGMKHERKDGWSGRSENAGISSES